MYIYDMTLFLSDMTRYMDEKPFNRVFLLVDSKVANSNSLHAVTHSNTHASHVTGLSCNTYHMLTHTCNKSRTRTHFTGHSLTRIHTLHTCKSRTKMHGNQSI